MIGPRRYFPWKIAQRFFVRHVVFMIFTLAAAGFLLREAVYSEFLEATDTQAGLNHFSHLLSTLFLFLTGWILLFFAYSTLSFVAPLGRLIQRARQLRRSDVLERRGTPVDQREEVDDQEIADSLDEEIGEWYDLERALLRMHRELLSRTQDLSREREELSALIGAVSDAIYAIDHDSKPLFFNSRFAVLFGLKSADKNRAGLSETFRDPEILRTYRLVLETGEPQVADVVLHTKTDEAPRFFSVSIAPLRAGDNGPVFGAIGVFHDVTELKQSEQIRIEFVGNASHELRTPLTTIKGYVDTLRDDVKSERYESVPQFVDVISRNVDRLTLLVSDLLDLSTLESGPEMKKSIVSTREVTETALRQLEHKRAQRRQSIDCSFQIESILADARRVEQVIINLVHNAIKYVPEDHKIEIVWEGVDGASLLRVKDNGSGIPPEHHLRLFERFYRVDPGRSRDQGGTGLGLAIVKHIMLKHSGSVRVSSRQGEGTEFICSFPD